MKIWLNVTSCPRQIQLISKKINLCVKNTWANKKDIVLKNFRFKNDTVFFKSFSKKVYDESKNSF